MDNKSEKIYQNHRSELTYTKRKQSPSNIYNNTNQTSSNARIFKYPYLDEKYDQYDNVSNKSTEKHKQRTHRKKIFDDRSVGSSAMKMSVLSVDRNRNNNPDFQSNPSRSKIKHGNKNRSVSGNNFHRNQRSNLSPTPSVVFHYQSPGFYPSNNNPVSGLKQVANPLFHQAPQVQVLSYPTQSFPKVDQNNLAKQSCYIPITSNIPHNHLPSPNEARNEIEYKRKQSPSIYNTLSNQTPKITYVINEKSQLQPSFIAQGGPSFNYSLFQRNQRVHNSQIYPSPQQNFQHFQPQFDRLNSKNVLFQSLEIKNEQSRTVNFVKPIMTNVKIVEQRKTYRKESPQKAQNTDPFKQMIETYKIGDNKMRSEIATSNVIVISNKGSPERLPKPLETSKQKLSTFYPQQQREQRKLNKVEQIDAVFEEIDQYSDRFFDMDFKDHQKLNSDQNRTQKQIFNDKKTVTKLSTSSMDLNQNRGKQLDFEDFSDSQDSVNGKVRSKSSTGVEMRVSKQHNSIIKKDFRKNIQNLIEQKLYKIFRKVDSQGKLLTWFLVGIGFMLVILQLFK